MGGSVLLSQFEGSNRKIFRKRQKSLMGHEAAALFSKSAAEFFSAVMTGIIIII